MNRIGRLIIAMAVFIAAASANTLPIVQFTLDPLNGSLAGAAGTSVGWGYTITSTDNGSPAFVFIESFAFGDETSIGTFSSFDSGVQFGVPSTAASDGSPIIAHWEFNTSGLQYDIRPDALLWATSVGVMTMTYGVYFDADQTYDSGYTINAQFNDLDLNAKVSVNAQTTTVPEPGALTLLVFGVAGLLFGKWRLSRPASSGDR